MGSGARSRGRRKTKPRAKKKQHNESIQMTRVDSNLHDMDINLETVDLALTEWATYLTVKPVIYFQEFGLKTKIKPPIALKLSALPATKPLVHPNECQRIISEAYIKKCDTKVSALQRKVSGLAEDMVALKIPGVGVFSTVTLKIMKRWHRAMKVVKT